MRKCDELADPTSCLNRADDDEQLFVLLGRDPAVPAAIYAWVAERIRLSKNLRSDPQIVSALTLARRLQGGPGEPGAPPWTVTLSSES